jgi:hypothetical protein
MQRFLEYEAYAAYNDLIGDSATLIKTFGWRETEKGIEALSVLTLPSENLDADNRKALTFSDLIIKVRFTVLISYSSAYVTSLYNVYASIHCSFKTCARTLPHAMIQSHMQNLRRFFLGFNESRKR